MTWWFQLHSPEAEHQPNTLYGSLTSNTCPSSYVHSGQPLWALHHLDHRKHWRSEGNSTLGALKQEKRVGDLVPDWYITGMEGLGLGWGCLMTSGLSKDFWCHVWPYFSDIRPHITWAVSLLIAYGHFIIFLSGLYGLTCSLYHPEGRKRGKWQTIVNHTENRSFSPSVQSHRGHRKEQKGEGREDDELSKTMYRQPRSIH